MSTIEGIRKPKADPWPTMRLSRDEMLALKSTAIAARFAATVPGAAGLGQ